MCVGGEGYWSKGYIRRQLKWEESALVRDREKGKDKQVGKMACEGGEGGREIRLFPCQRLCGAVRERRVGVTEL